MQSTFTGKRILINRTKLALIAAVLLASTVAVVAASTLTSDAIAPAADRIVVHHPTDRPFRRNLSAPAIAAPSPGQATTWRMLEINELPGAITAKPSGLNPHQRMEMNELPDDAGQMVAPEIVRGARS